MLVFGIGFFSPAGVAQDRVTSPIDNSRLITLQGNRNPLAQPSFDHGAVAAGFPAERMMLVLRRSAEQDAALQEFLQSVQNPSSRLYHQYLTPEQFGEQYGISVSDLGAVSGWLRSQGFTVKPAAAGRMAIEFSGTAGQVESAFHTAIHSYVVNGEQHYANASDPEIPAALTAVVAGITLNNFGPRPLNRVVGQATLDPFTKRATPLYNLPDQRSDCLSGTCFAVVPGDFATIYDTKPLLASAIDGAGVTIGVIGVSNIDTSLVEQFRENFLPAYSATNLPNIIIDGPDPGTEDQGDEIEAFLDVEMAGAVAPKATVDLYIAANSYVANGVGLATQRALDDNQASILSLSFGECEAFLGPTYNQFYNNLFEQGAAQGMTVLVSTGDSGSAMCDPPVNTSGPTQAVSGLFVNGLASTPYNVAVGGTDFYYPANATLDTLSAYWNMPTAADPNNNADWSSAKSYIPEKPWDLSDPVLDQVNLSPSLGAGGGGASSCTSYTGPTDAGDTANKADCHGGYAKPSWQTGFGSDQARDLPDVSLFASNGSNYSFTAICAFPGDCAVPNAGPDSVSSPLQVLGVGGTSVSAPAMAGIMALIVEKTGSRQGQANTVLYPLSQKFPLAFHDIAVGTNTVDCQAGTPDCGADGYLTGYNATTGYDLATGIGSIDAALLVGNWSAMTLKPTATTLQINPTTAVHGTALTFTVNVTGGPTSGDIALLITHPAGTAQGQYTTTCAAFPCVFTYSALPGGSYDVSARYAGNTVYAASTSAGVPVTISPESSEVAIYYQAGYSLSKGFITNLNGQTDLKYGAVVLFSSKPVPANAVLPASEFDITSTPATGTVSVSDFGAAVGGPLPLDATGQAVFEDFNLAVGKHSLVVSYPGDASYSASNTVSPLATPLNFTIGPTTATLSLQPYYQQVLPGTGASITASIPFEGQQGPTGTVTVSVMNPSGVITVLPAAALSVIEANYFSAVTVNIPASSLGSGPSTIGEAGNNIVTASYSGDSNYEPEVQQTPASIYDAKPYTNIVLYATPAGVVAGQSIAITARVGWIDLLNVPGYPGGSVTFLDGTNTLGTVTTVPDAYGNGIATFTTSTLTVGTHTITANYLGNAQFLASTASITVVVSPAPPPALDFTLSATPVVLGSGFNPSGTSTVTFVLSYAATSAGSISLACTPPAQLPAMSCAVPSPVSFAAGATTGTGTVTVSIVGDIANVKMSRSSGRLWLAAGGGLTLAFLLPFGFRARRRRWRVLLGALLLLVLVAGIDSCDGVHLNGPPVAAGNYNVTVTATLGAATHQATIAVTVP